MGLKKPLVFFTASILSLIIGLAPPASAQGRGGGGGGGGGRNGGGNPGGPPPGGGGGGGGGRPGAGAPVYAPGRPVYGPGRPVYRPGVGRYPYYGYRPYYGYGYRYYGYPYSYAWYGSPYFYAGWGWPYAGYPYYYPYAVGAIDPSGSLRLEVTPREAEVYVDGYMAGIVDQFDGTFQRLRVPPGGHELTLYRDGFRTVHQSLHVSSGSTLKVSYNMEPLAAGEIAEPRPTPPPRPADEDEGAPGTRSSPQTPARRPPPARAVAGFGTLDIRVQPVDAIVLIDGERWQSSGQDRLTVEVPEGPHRIEITKDGFDTYSTDVTVAQGQTMPINVSLRSR